MKWWLTGLIGFGALLPSFVFAHAISEDALKIQIFDTSGTEVGSFQPFDDDYRGTASVATVDLGGDGVEEILIGSGPGLAPYILVYRQDGSLIGKFLAYSETYGSGVYVDACDVTGDSVPEIITGTMYGGGPHVRVFTAAGEPLSEGFFAYASDFRGGVSVACGDIDGDGVGDIVTGPGMSGGPHVRIFYALGNLQLETFVGSATENTGAMVAVADLDADGDDELMITKAGYGDSNVVVLDEKDGKLSFVLSLAAFSDENGAAIFSGDIDGDGMDEIGATEKGTTSNEVALFEMTGAKRFSLTPFSDSEEHGVLASILKNHDDTYVLTLTSADLTRNEADKYIEVDLSEQTLSAYENGVLVRSFLVSSGVSGYSTPVDRTGVSAKLEWHDYTWYYGENDPRNYDLRDVQYNLRFRTHFYIHYAYWHHNFGHVMSHGCVNVGYTDAEWIFNWADIGTTVNIVP